MGDGPRRRELEQLARTLGVTEQVHFLGHRTDVPAIYARGTFGVLCSTHEGLSNAVMEGMAAGLPMVVTRVGGNPELVKHGERGLVVPVEAPVLLAAAFNRLLADPARAREMGLEGRAFVERELSLQKMVAAHDAVYRHVARGEPLQLPQDEAPQVRVQAAAQRPVALAREAHAPSRRPPRADARTARAADSSPLPLGEGQGEGRGYVPLSPTRARTPRAAAA